MSEMSGCRIPNGIRAGELMVRFSRHPTLGARPAHRAIDSIVGTRAVSWIPVHSGGSEGAT